MESTQVKTFNEEDLKLKIKTNYFNKLYCFFLNDNLYLNSEDDFLFFNNLSNDYATIVENSFIDINLKKIPNRIKNIILLGENTRSVDYSELSLETLKDTGVNYNIEINTHTRNKIIELVMLERDKDNNWVMNISDFDSGETIHDHLLKYYNEFIIKK